jgi:hypothetical protein
VGDGQDRGGGPPRLARVKPIAPGASRGLAAAEVTPAAAIAAGLAHQGDVAAAAPLHLWYLAAAAQVTGRLELGGERGAFALDFKRGVVEHAASTAPEDDLGRYLVARGAVTAEALADAERVKDGFGDLVTALAHLRLLNPAESYRVLQEHGVLVLGRALAVERGTFRWDPAAKAPPSAFPLGSRWGMPCDAARRLDGLAVRRLLGERAQRVASRSGGRVELSELRLTAHEARASSLFDGRSSPARLAAAHPGDVESILRMALVLGEMELLAFGEVVAAAPVPVPGASPSRTPSPTSTAVSTPTPTPTGTSTPTPIPTATPRLTPAPAAKAIPKPPAASPAPPRPVVPRDVAALRAVYERLATADHFEALGVKRDATPAQVKAAYFQLAKTYHPDAAPASEPAETKRLRADIFARLGAAWRVLGDEAARAGYLEELKTGGQVDVSRIFEAEDLFQKAVVLVRARQYERALALLHQAEALNADEPEFGVWKAWVAFLLAADKKAQGAESAAAIEHALKKNPRCLPGYLFLGQMAKLQGDAALAERHLKRGLALDPDHADLARELKFLRK